MVLVQFRRTVATASIHCNGGAVFQQQLVRHLFGGGETPSESSSSPPPPSPSSSSPSSPSSSSCHWVRFAVANEYEDCTCNTIPNNKHADTNQIEHQQSSAHLLPLCNLLLRTCNIICSIFVSGFPETHSLLRHRQRK